MQLPVELLQRAQHRGFGLRAVRRPLADQRGDLAVAGGRGPVVEEPHCVGMKPRPQPRVGCYQPVLGVALMSGDLAVALKQGGQLGGQLTSPGADRPTVAR